MGEEDDVEAAVAWAVGAWAGDGGGSAATFPLIVPLPSSLVAPLTLAWPSSALTSSFVRPRQKLRKLRTLPFFLIVGVLWAAGVAIELTLLGARDACDSIRGRRGGREV